jgi:hypothetical protein
MHRIVAGRCGAPPNAQGSYLLGTFLMVGSQGIVVLAVVSTTSTL